MAGKLKRNSIWIYCGAFTLLAWRLVVLTRLGLGDDEAYYWDWSRHLSLSYFDHPPLVAWLIAVSQAVLPRAAWAVRAPFLGLSGLTAVGFFHLSRRLGAEKPWLNTAVTFLLIPIFSLGAGMAFPDAPMMAAWVWALVATWRIEERPESLRRWLELGAAVGLAILSKLTGLLLLASLFVWLISAQKSRRWFLGWRLWAGLALALIVIAPVLLWNWRNGFPTFRFQLLERHQNGAFSPARFGTFLAAQLLVLSPLGWFLSFKVLRSARSRWLWCFSLPGLLVFYLQPWIANFLLHWPAPAYLPLLAALNWPASRGARWNFVYLLAVGFLFLGLCSFPLMSALAERGAWPASFQAKHEFSNDFYGGDEAGRWIRELVREEQTRTGHEPSLLTSRYQLAGTFAFDSGLEVSAVGPRANAYRFFADSPYVRSWEGRQVLFLADNRYTQGPDTVAALSGCTPLRSLEVHRFGYLSRRFSAWACRWSAAKAY